MNLKPKKSLGQNFLRDRKVLEKIIEAADLKADDVVLEIGPGKGVLTEELAKKVKQVIAIEIDRELVDFLKNKFKNQGNIKIIYSDILKLDLNEFYTKYQILNTKYKVVANIPYYITQPIIRLLLESKIQPVEIILMVQEEVARNITALPGKMGLLSVAVSYYAEAQYLFKVPGSAFFPKPEVESAVIRIIPKKRHNPGKDALFFRLVRAGFCAKRKTLVNNLASSFHLEKEFVTKKIKKTGLNLNSRAQELSVEDWRKLEREFNNKIKKV